MQTDITVTTAAGYVRLRLTSAHYFDLQGSDEAIAHVIDQVPVLQAKDNPIDIAPDAIGRLIFLEAECETGREIPRTIPRLMTHKELQDQSFTENPVILFQTRADLSDIRNSFTRLCEDWGIPADGATASEFLDQIDENDEWKTEAVFIDPRDAEDFHKVQQHRYPEGKRNEQWRIFVGVAKGRLCDVIRKARDLDNL